MTSRSTHAIVSLLFMAASALAGAQSAPPPPPHEVSTYLTIEQGTLPLVFSVPHGGDEVVAGVAVRTKGTTVRDDHVNELAAAIQRVLRVRTGKQAYLVGAKVSRKYVDFNRDAAQAYQDPALQAVYEEYYGALQRAVATVRGKPGALLIDIHGQSAVRGAILRGTKDGLTADNAPFYAQPAGLITGLNARGMNVQPAELGGVENPSFDGGNIVRTFGRNNAQGIDSVQLEFGADWRASPEMIERTATAVADALVAHLRAQGAL